MEFKCSKAAIAGLILSISGFANAALIVTQNNNAADLVANILGAGISTSNISNSGDASQFGTFTGGMSAGIGIESGIMLSTGNVNLAVGPNTQPGTTGEFFGPGDTALDTLSGFATEDAAFLTFDFVSSGGDVFFEYVFASEEYLEFVSTGVNDVFGFFIDGVNIALIPGTSTAVSIDTVNTGVNSEFYNDNPIPFDPPFDSPFDIEYDGFTTVFTASALGLSAGTHTIRMGIADAGDSIVDSTVFIRASSFSDVSIASVPEPPVLAILALGIIGLVSRRYRKQ